MLTKDKENEEIHYYVVTALADLSKYTTKAKQKKLFQFVGNADFEGIVIFSKTDGTFVKAMHVHDGKSHPIIFGHTHALPTTRSQNGNTDNEGTTLTLTSQFSNYDGQETGEGVQGEHKCTCSPCQCIDCPGNKVYCAICGEYYDINWESCPNNCDVTITPGGGGGGEGGIGIDYYVTCSYCLRSYNPLIYNECPFGCNKRCDVCGHYPCTCVNIEDNHRCERCGSPDCPGPWVCGRNEDDNDYEKCPGTQCPICGGYKDNNPGCPVCTCDQDKISLTVVPFTIDLGQQFSTKVSIGPSYSDLQVSHIEYSISYNKDNSSMTLGESTALSKTFKAYSPGTWLIQATVTFDNGMTVDSNTFPLFVQNPLYSDIMNNPTVKAKMDALWAASVQDAENKPNASYHEKGCIIYFNTTDNSYEFEDVPDSEEFECEGSVEIHFKMSTTIGYPDRGGKYPVATFHTHPARTKCDQYTRYAVGPSSTDEKMGTVCLLYDYKGKNGTIFGGHSAKDSYQLYHCAQERHPLRIINQ